MRPDTNNNPGASLKPTIKNRFRKIAYWLLWATGIVAYLRYRNRHRVTIITFHGVMDDSQPAEWVPLRHRTQISDFRNCLTWMSQHYQFVSMNTAADILEGMIDPIENAAVITFDDGYLNNFTIALPIMKELNIPGIFYVATGIVEDGGPFWFDRLDYAVQMANATRARHEYENGSGRADLAESFGLLRDELKDQDISEHEFRKTIEAEAGRLEEIAGCSLVGCRADPWAGIADWNVLAEAVKSSCAEIGSHSVNHSRLSHETSQRVMEEARLSKMAIENNIAQECLHFAYPNGAHNNHTRSCISQSGYRTAVTSDVGTNEVGADLFALKRVYPPTDMCKYELLARIAGVRSGLRSLCRAMFRA